MTEEAPELKRRPWSKEEDEALRKLCEGLEQPVWTNIAASFPGRKPKQCRERWINHLRMDLQEKTWTYDEDQLLLKLSITIGHKWSQIATKFPGRSENSIKNRYYSSIRKRLRMNAGNEPFLIQPIKRGRTPRKPVQDTFYSVAIQPLQILNDTPQPPPQIFMSVPLSPTTFNRFVPILPHNNGQSLGNTTGFIPLMTPRIPVPDKKLGVLPPITEFESKT